MGMTPRLSSLLTAAVLVGSLAACSNAASTDRAADPDVRSTPSTSASPTPGRISMAAVELVRVETTGGMCAEGECGSTTVVHGDGAWEVTDADGTRNGTLSFEDLTEVIRLSTTTDPAARPKPAESCDSWADGRDVALTYSPMTGDPVTVSSCDYDLSKSALLRFGEKSTAA